MLPDNYVAREDVFGPAALRRYRQLVPQTREVAVKCQYTGKNTATLRFGCTARYAYVLTLDPGGCDRLMIQPRADTSGLFTHWVRFLELRQELVDSSPTSPQYFAFTPDADRLRPLLERRFGLEVRSLSENER